MLNQANENNLQENLTTLQEIKKERPPFVSHTNTTVDLSQEQMLKDIREKVFASIAQDEIKDLIWRINNNAATEDLFSAVNGYNLAFANVEDLKDLVQALLNASLSPESYKALHTTVLFLTENNSTGLVFFQTADDALIKDLLERVSFDFGLSHSIADGWTKAKLKSLAQSLNDEELKNYYLSPERDLKELMSVAQYLGTEERIKLALELSEAASKAHSTADVVSDKFDNLMHYYSAEEKALVLSMLISAPAKYNYRAAPTLLRSCETLDELVRVVEGVGTNRLLSYESTEVKNSTAIALLASQFRDLNLPLISTDKTTAEKRAYALQEVYKQGEEILKKASNLKNTSAYRDYESILKELANNFAKEINSVENQEALNSLVNRYIKQTELSFKYMVKITTGESDYLNKKSKRADVFVTDLMPQEGPAEEEPLLWRLKDLYDVEAVLKKIPEGDLLLTPLLQNIELVDYLGRGVLGARYSNGTIKIATLSLDLERLSEQYEGVSSLKIVLAHEIGHGIQIGDNSVDIEGQYSLRPSFGEGEPVIDFDEFYKIAGWQIYARDRYFVDPKTGDIILDGKSIPLETPIEVDGKERVFMYDVWSDLLISYDADGEFSSRWYAKTSPWEDFAEAFSEYLFVPERLVYNAPHKFKHLEEEFKVYENDKYIQDLLRKELENSTNDN